MPTFRLLGKILLADVVMLIVLSLVKLVIPISSSVRLLNIPIIAIYALIGVLVYFFVSHKFNLIEEVFGSKLINKITSKFRRK